VDPILQHARDGDPAAWQVLVDQHSTLLRRYLDRRMGPQLRRTCSSGDLVQEVLTRMLHALRAAPADATLQTFRRWLLQHADWVLASRGHGARRHFGESVAGVIDGSLADRSPATTGPVTHADQVAWMRSLLDRLDPKYADVVRLRLDGVSFAEIAERLGVEEATVRQRLSRVLRTLSESHRDGD
jgi:RNA polymerase sigma factor (sigma-70 family)